MNVVTNSARMTLTVPNDSCNPDEGCVFTPNHGSCTERSEFSVGTCDPILGCPCEPDDPLCDDGVDRKDDFCAILGCQNNPYSAAKAERIKFATHILAASFHLAE